MITITQAAKLLGKSVKTLQRWDRKGILVAERSKTNRRVYSRTDLDSFIGKSPTPNRRNVAYCRVSSRNQKQDLLNQRNAVLDFCAASGIQDIQLVEEIGGGLNFNRPEFLKLIRAILTDEIGTLVLAHRDRLARFGYELLEQLCEDHGVKIVVVNDIRMSPEQEMVQDLMTIVHYFSSRLYGLSIL